MEKRNHKFIAQKIYDVLKNNDIELRRKFFILGNLAPDITYSFLFRRHQFNTSCHYLNKKIQSLCKGALSPQSRLFSYRLGVVMHYVCDYFCYAHSSAFKGTLRDHIRYEKSQSRPEDIALQPQAYKPLFSPGDARISGEMLMSSLNSIVDTWEQWLRDRIPKPQTDIQQAIDVGIWATSAIYMNAAKQT